MDNWIKKLNFSDEVKELFNEAILCYKIKANRASLLFSYLAFYTIIKERIIKSRKPDNILQGRWDNIIKDLNNDDKWEARIYEELTNSSSPIFNIKESIREHIKYWKDRRNDCVHYKDNEINNHHIEVFWTFIKSNLNKISIDGGMMDLLNKFKIHFDITQTPPNKDYDYLIGEIETTIEPIEFNEFIDNLNQILNHSFLFDDKKISNFYYSLLIKLEHSKLIEFIKKSNLDIIIIEHNSQAISLLKYSENEIRNIWKKRIQGQYDDKRRYNIYSILLRNNLIPKTELFEAMKDFFFSFNQNHFNNLPSSKEYRKTISNRELLDIIYDYYFIEERILYDNDWDINYKSDLIELLFEYKLIDEKMVKCICKMYDNGKNPYWLTDNLKRLFDENPEKYNEFNTILSKKGLKIPDRLK